MTSIVAVVDTADSGVSSPQEGGKEAHAEGKEHNHEHDHEFHLPHHYAKRLLRFVHPHTGKTTIICPTPEEVGK